MSGPLAHGGIGGAIVEIALVLKHGHDHSHGHSHGLVDPLIKRSRDGLRAVGISLGVLGATALAQGAIFAFSNSVALLADLIHNVGDGLVSLGVVLSAIVVSIGLDIADPLIGLAITPVILRITWHSWRTIRAG